MAIREMGTCPGFDATMKASESRRYVSGPVIEAPVTVGFGSRDLLLLPHQSRHLDELPPGTRVEKLAGCGHVPMADNPRTVAAFIAAAAAARRSTS
jgi:pimeloyl-ACP methyl ester carboxylesterase